MMRSRRFTAAARVLASHVIAIVALAVAPATLPAQGVSMARAGIQPHLALTLPARADTVTVDSDAPHRSRAKDAFAGALIGAVAGGVGGALYAKEQTHRGNEVAGLDVPFFAAVGIIGGAIIGALWPAH